MGRSEQVEALAGHFASGTVPSFRYLRILMLTQPSSKELIDLGVGRQHLEKYLQQVEQHMDGGAEDGTEGRATSFLRTLCGDYRPSAGHPSLRLGVYLGLDKGDAEPQYYQVLGPIKLLEGFGDNHVAYFPLHGTGLGPGLRSRAESSFFGLLDNGEPRFTYVGKQVPVPEPAEEVSV